MSAPVIWRPQPKQAAFMCRPEPEALYGGAAGGGKKQGSGAEAAAGGVVLLPAVEERT